MAYEKPVPVPNRETQPYWEACQRGELALQTCEQCGHVQFYPRLFCTSCQGESLTWKAASGRGTVYTFTVIRRAPSKAFKADVPYVLALIELDEGVRLMSNVVECQPESVHIGMPVQVLFDQITAEIALPKFRPA